MFVIYLVMKDEMRSKSFTTRNAKERIKWKRISKKADPGPRNACYERRRDPQL